MTRTGSGPRPHRDPEASSTTSAGISGATDGGWLDAALRRQVTYLHLQDLVVGRDVVEAWPGRADPRGAATLLARGARRVTVVADGHGGAAERVAQVQGAPRRTGLPAASADVFIALETDAAELAAAIGEARRVLRPEGVLLLGVPSRDRPGARGGASYYDLVDACTAFPRVQMIGLAPFVGSTLVEYGVADPEPILDGTMVERGERVEHYLVVAGPERRGDFGYGVVQVPLAAVNGPGQASGQGLGEVDALRAQLARREAELAEARRTASGPAPTPAPDPGNDRVVAELRQAIERHAGEMRAREIELQERDAYIAELERDGRRVHELEGRVTAAEAQRAEADHREREARRRIAELEGRLRAAAGGGGGGGGSAGGPDVEALRRKLAEAESESWKQMKARSEAEAAAAEVRDDTVRKLKDARKLASVELMRAMEEATRKAVTLREELTRCEAERKAALAELKAAREQAPPATDERLAELALEVQRREAVIERTASVAAHERARCERLVAGERQALAERNDARARAAEADARVAAIDLERERAAAALAHAEARFLKAEGEVEGKRERIRELKRELEEAERRAAESAHRGQTLELVRSRVQALEAAVAGEASRVAALEASLREGAV